MKRTYEVVIAGAGPVGLWLACELKLAGVDVAVIERRTERTAQSRALTIHGRSLEILALRGLAGQLLEAGKQIPTGHYAVLDTRLDFSPFDTRFPFTLFLPQAVTEARLEQRAGELGVALMRGSAVTAIRDHGDGVEVATEAGDLAAGYLVGADGARSMVREGAGIAYEGFDAANTMMLGDVVLSVKPKVPVVSVTNQHGSVMIVPLGDGTHHRIVLIDPLRAHVHRAEPLTLEELANSTARILGEDFQPRAPIWLSRFADETRLAATYRKGRILLAGDAAHIHAPMGGQGMNVGLQDAMNLGWKLAAVIKGKAPEDLLDSYTAERRPVGQILYNNTLAQVALITRLDAATLALRDTLNDLLAMPPVNRRLAGELSGFDVAYGAEASGALAVGRLVEGSRVPDIDLVIGEGITASLYSLLSDGNWLHLSFSPGALAKGPAWLPAEDIRTVLAEPVDRDAFRDIGALLVRPDGYAAAVVR